MAYSTHSSLECSICSEDLADPRALPCGHSYCGPDRKCLEALEQPDNRNIVRCALCNEQFQKPKLSLKPLYGIREFLQESSKSSMKQMILPKCETHPKMPVLFWCLTDKQRACGLCFEVEHNGHKLESFKTYLQKQVGDKLHNNEANLVNRVKEADQLITACENQVIELDKVKTNYKTLVDMLRNGKALIEKDFKQNQSCLQKFAKGDESDVSLSAIMSFLNLNENLREFKNLIAEKDTKILGYRRIQLKTRFMIVRTYLKYEIKGSYAFEENQISFEAECGLPSGFWPNSPVAFSVIRKDTCNQLDRKEVEFYGDAQIKSATKNIVTTPAGFRAKGIQGTRIASNRVVLATWQQLFDRGQKLANDDWSFDVSWTLVFKNDTN